MPSSPPGSCPSEHGIKNIFAGEEGLMAENLLLIQQLARRFEFSYKPNKWICSVAEITFSLRAERIVFFRAIRFLQ